MRVFTGQNQAIFSDPVNRRLVGGLLFSILVHALVLSMQLGIPGLGLPALELPWKERRANVQPITIRIANPEQAALLAMPKPVIAPPLPPVINPAPVKPTPAMVANTGIRVLDAVVVSKPVSVQKKIVTGKQKTIAPPVPPTRLARPAVDLPDTPTRVIAQDQLRDDNFAMPLPDQEEPIRKNNENKSTKENAKPTVAETFDQAELSEEELAKSAELAIAKEIENAEKEKAEKLLKKARKLADQLAEKQAEQNKRELDAALAAQALENQMVAKKLEDEKQKQQAARQIEETAKQQDLALALQKKMETEEQEKRLQKQEALRLETQRKQQQIAQDLEAHKQIEVQEKQMAAIRQQQLDEQALKQKTEQLAARLKAEELAAHKAAEQKLAEQKLAEQKLAEQKLAEQKLAEQKLAEQKLAEQKLAEQKLAEQKLAEQKLAEQKLAEQKLVEQRATDQRIAEQRAAAQRERALADAASKASTAGSSANANGSAGGANLVLPRNNFSSDLANRAREQSKDWDVLSGTTPASRQSGPDLSSRRRSILGSFDREVPLRMYVESWRQKVERNGNFNYAQSSKDKARGDPVVIVAIRSDGSVEDVTIVRSSGRVDIDEAVSRIVRLNAPYAVFPQNIAAKYDVIEIRRVWRFDETLRIVEEVR